MRHTLLLSLYGFETLPTKSLATWAGGIILVLCCAAAIALGVWQILPRFSDQAILAAINTSIEIPTATPIPVIDRTPVSTLPRLNAEPTESTSLKLAPTATLSATISTPNTEPTQGQETDPQSGQSNSLQLSTEESLTQAILPERNLRLLAIRLKNNGQEIPETISGTTSFQVGDTDTFWISDNQATPPRQFQANATLRYLTDHSYWWVEDGININEDNLKRSADRFENQTYPTNRAFFGSEWSPGVDNNVRIHIFLGDVPGVAGYFSASHSYTNLVDPFSNQKEMVFINLRAISPGNDNFDGVLAHEFQHMIHWYQDRNEDTWVNEGMSELATFINGYGVSSFIGAFTAVPDTQLTGWTDSPNGALANYGGSFLFMAYFLQRFGEEMTRAVVAHAQNSISGFDVILAENGYSERFNDVFADFVIANYLNDLQTGDGLWGYRDVTINPIAPTERYSVYPIEQKTSVYQFGSDYIELTGNSDIEITFTGSTQVKVVDNEPHSGAYHWYSHRGDDSNSRLTRAFDLSQVSTATLNYWTWYDIEADWDYAYVEISTDGGQSWDIMQTPHSATDNPSGNAYGPGYTGLSGAEQAIWIEESLDISAYTGQEVLVRFEYVTDDAVNRPGWTIDDISIPEIGFFDDVESGINGWQAEGFVRIDNILPQRFLVQLLEIGDEIEVRSLSLDQTNYGDLKVSGLGGTIDRAVLIISGVTPVTSQPASYKYTLTLSEE